MKKMIAIVITICILLIMVFSTGAAPVASQDVSADIAEMKKEVLSLRERIKSLEDRLENVTTILPQLKSWKQDLIINGLEDPLQYRQNPKGWQQRQFNGHLYYLIPLEQEAKLPRFLEK